MIAFIVGLILVWFCRTFIEEVFRNFEKTKPIYIWMRYGSGIMEIVTLVGAWIVLMVFLFGIGMFEYGHWFKGLLVLIVTLILACIEFGVIMANYEEAKSNFAARKGGKKKQQPKEEEQDEDDGDEEGGGEEGDDGDDDDGDEEDPEDKPVNPAAAYWLHKRLKK